MTQREADYEQIISSMRLEQLREICCDFYNAMHMHSRHDLWDVYYRLKKIVNDLKENHISKE
jgi:hypothetical protein